MTVAENDGLRVDLDYALEIECSTSFSPYRLNDYPFEEIWMTARLDPETMDVDSAELEAAGLPLILGRGKRTLVGLHSGDDLVLALDERDVDSLDLASYIFSGDELKPDVETMCECGLGGSVLLMDHFALDPAWRGLGLGPLISLATMRTLALGRDVTCAALHAAPPLSQEQRALPEADLRKIAKKISKSWERCGFRKLTKTREGWIMVAPGVGDATWPDELWPGLLQEVQQAVGDHLAARVRQLR